MRAVIQRVRNAGVVVDGASVASIDRGLLAYVGVQEGDERADAVYVASKIAGVRVFPDQDGRMNLALDAVTPVDGERVGVIAISQFTLHGDMRKGRRPSYNAAAAPGEARGLYETVVHELEELGIRVETGVFGAHMDVAYVNDGPVTLLLDSRKLF